MHELAIITINYNASEFTKKCVASVLENTPKDLDYIMVIVDNASEKSEFEPNFCIKVPKSSNSLFSEALSTITII